MFVGRKDQSGNVKMDSSKLEDTDSAFHYLQRKTRSDDIEYVDIESLNLGVKMNISEHLMDLGHFS